MIDTYGVQMPDSFGGSDGGASGADGAAGDGAAIPNSTVVLTDSKGKTVSATTDANGKYHVLITGFVPPMVGYVIKPNGSRWYAPSIAIPVTRGFININLTGLTDKIASDIATANGKTSSSQLTTALITPVAVSTAITNLNSSISAQIVAAGLNPATFNPITTPLVTNGKGHDQILDNLAISNSSSTPTVIGPKYSLGGSITGLGTGSGLSLKNGAETLSIPSGATSFQFATQVAPATTYNITIGNQPSGASCAVSNGTGLMGNAALNTVVVVCNANTVALGGSISGLTLSGLVLANAGQSMSVPSGASSFTLPAQVPQGGNYAITVQTQPTGGSCSVTNGIGTAGANAITNVAVTCSANKFTVNGVVNGISSVNTTQLILANGGDSLPWSLNGGTGFVFPTSVAAGQSYNVTIQQQQPGYACTVANGSGTMGAAAVTNVAVNCTALPNALGGTVTGLTGSGLVLSVGSQGLTVPANASSFTFSTGLTEGTSYNVTVQTQPTGQTCSVSNGSGTMGTSAVNNVAVTCSSNLFTLGGAITPYMSGVSITLTSNGQSATYTSFGLASVTPFTFATPIASGTAYNVTVATQPVGYTCTVSNGSGTIVSANVTNVAVNCVGNQYTLGGTVTGLTSPVTLVTGAQTVNIAANATSFTFPSTFSTGGGYFVTVQAQPTGLTCTVTNGSGTFSAASINSVALNCSANTSFLQVVPRGMSGQTVVLKNGSETVSIVSNCGFFCLSPTTSFTTKLALGASYNVSIQSNSGSVCLLDGVGTISQPLGNTINLVCDTNLIINVSGLTSTDTAPTFTLNGTSSQTPIFSNIISVWGNVGFGPFSTGTNYAITVTKQPVGKTCTISNPTGTIPSVLGVTLTAICQ